jgi:hypothetical protein
MVEVNLCIFDPVAKELQEKCFISVETDKGIRRTFTKE